MMVSTAELNIYSPVDHNLHYLALELTRIDIAIRRAVRRWQLAGQNPADKFRGLYISPDEAVKLSERPFGSNWGTEIDIPEGEESLFKEELAAAEAKSQQLADQAGEGNLKLAYLAKVFDLSVFEYQAFLICLAPALDPHYERLYGFLQDDVTRRYASAGLILDLLLPPGIERLPFLDFFSDQSILLNYGLLHKASTEASTLIRKEFTVAAEVVSWLLGAYHPAAEVANCIHLHQAPFTNDLSTAFKDDQAFSRAANPDDSLRQHNAILAFYGADQQRQLAAGLALAASSSYSLFEVSLDGLKAANLLDRNILRILLRDARLNHAIPFFCGWDCFIDENGFVPGTIHNELNWLNGPVIVSSSHAWQISGTANQDEKPVFWYFFDLPANRQRLQLWRYFLNGTRKVSDADLEILSGQFILASTQIGDAVRTAANTALQLGRPVEAGDLFDAARQHSSHHLDNLAVKIKSRYHWKDIVLPEDETSMLKEIVVNVRSRSLVLDTWGLGKKLVSNNGVSALFAGPPGTGKTLAAQVISAELGMDLYKIDLSTVVSKYIGETEKNLERIFTQARNSNTVLFFDEADAIFGKRSEVKDAHDRYANIEVGYLLQRMESYDGVVILATNLRSNLDDAFTRRLQFIVDFPFPDEKQRLNIWKVLFPPEAPRDPDIDFESLAKRFKLAGGSIRNVIVSASFLAANEGNSVSNRHLLHSVRREMQKMGRLINEKDLVL